MKQTINRYQFAIQFERIRPDQFSREALHLLWNYFEQYEDDCQVEMELDVIAICCQFTEQSVLDVASDYDIDLADCIDADERLQAVTEYLEDHTTIIGILDDGKTIVYDSEF